MPEVLSAVEILSVFFRRFSTSHRINGKNALDLLIASASLCSVFLFFSSFTDLLILNYELFLIFTKKSVKITVTKNSANLRPPTDLCCGSYDVLIGQLYDYLTERNNTSLRCISRQQTLLQ